MNGQAVSRRPSAEGCSADTKRGGLVLTHAPGTYLMQVLVFTSFNGLAVSDPVWEPHADNTDVIVTRHAPTGLPSAPLAGTNPDDLVAQGSIRRRSSRPVSSILLLRNRRLRLRRLRVVVVRHHRPRPNTGAPRGSGSTTP